MVAPTPARPYLGAVANAAQVLLKLLKHTSAERLEVMLDPVELIDLLVSFGWKKEDIERELGEGRKPGELLLRLFEEHGADAVFDALPPRAQSRAKTIAEQSKKKATVSGQLESMGLPRRRLAGALVALTGSVWAAMYILGSTPEWGSGMSIGSVAFAVIAGVAGGAWSTRDETSSAGALGGLACAVTTLLVAWVVSTQLVDPPGRLIVIGAVLPGALVGLAVAGLLLRRRDVSAF